MRFWKKFGPMAQCAIIMPHIKFNILISILQDMMSSLKDAFLLGWQETSTEKDLPQPPAGQEHHL